MVSKRQSQQPGRVASTQRVYLTFGGERAELRLVDGTKVRLAPDSRLRVPPEYSEDRRDVYLDGEAYFDVVHDQGKPFTVFAGNASARDIGTAFGVRNYPQDSAVQVVVRSGEVALSGLGRLSAGDLGRLAADGHTSVRHGVDVEKALGWLKGSHSYADTPLSRVLEDMNRWYNITVTLGDSTLASLPFTGTIAETSPTAAIELVAATLGLTVHGDGARMLLVAGHSAPRRLSTSP
jgi:ferric-dicitrate binding protein FerR (iron transport regulator)